MWRWHFQSRMRRLLAPPGAAAQVPDQGIRAVDRWKGMRSDWQAAAAVAHARHTRLGRRELGVAVCTRLRSAAVRGVGAFDVAHALQWGLACETKRVKGVVNADGVNQSRTRDAFAGCVRRCAAGGSRVTTEMPPPSTGIACDRRQDR